MSAPTPSVRAFHAITVRMLSDARFRDAVYRDPVATLADSGLSPEERRWFARPDPRAFSVDPLRNARLLTALLDEFPVSALALAEAGWRVPRFHSFFESPSFHGAIDNWTSLFFAFPAWLLASVPATAKAIRAMITLEAAFARVRRARFIVPSVGPRTVMLAPSTVAALVPAGAVALWEGHHRALRVATGGGAARIAEAIGDGKGLPRRQAGFEAALAPTAEVEAVSITATGVDGEPQLAFIGEGLAVVLMACHEPVPVAACIRVAVAEGLDEDEAAELLEELVGDGTLLTGG